MVKHGVGNQCVVRGKGRKGKKVLGGMGWGKVCVARGSITGEGELA